ncbi:MAG: NIPSNAP family containing protein [Acidimicrobiia bacterium]|jgi:hypothetical protein|nr:NIPSNAP family containing protein [Acidimicrobiia bacterium]MBP8181381.1 NIPSNAP family containing protein [Acidimicrobiia bacterium]
MTHRYLYLHEVIDIIGEGSQPYMAHTVDFKADSAAGRGLQLMGTWQVVGSTGRWPQVVNLWEMIDGWEGWRRLTRSTNIERQSNHALAEWWQEAYNYRTGGLDRLLGAGPSCPSLEDLVASGASGELFVHEYVKVRPGSTLDYLAAVVEERKRVMADYGHTLIGAYETLLHDDEAIIIWATDLESQISLAQAWDAARGLGGDRISVVDDRLQAWARHSRTFVRTSRAELMTPFGRSPVGQRPAQTTDLDPAG